jgi:hypothetical protein
VPFGPKADVEVELEPDEVLPGEAVEATVRVVPSRDLEVEEGRVELVYENEYTYKTRRYSFLVRMSWVRSETVTDVVVEDTAAIFESGALLADTPYEHTATLAVPATAAPSAEGEITSVRWWAIATLARRRGRDLRGSAELLVLSEPQLELESAVVATHRDCEHSFELDRDDFGPGEVLKGTLVARALRQCAVREVRVELVRHEEVPRDEGYAVEVTEDAANLDGEVELSPGESREWPFELELPEVVVPSLRTDQSRVTWLLRGIGSRRLRGDYSISLPIDVHTARS